MAVSTGTFRGFDVRIEDLGIVVITFNQPDRLNGMTMPMKRDLIETITQIQMDESLRIVVFTGSGKAFCAGDDISGNDKNTGGEALVPDIPEGFSTAVNKPLGTYNGLRAYSQTLNLAIRNLDKLTVAAINGFAIQTGMTLALCCDFRVASTEAKIGSGTLRFGLMPDEGSPYLLNQLIGVGKTMEFLMRNKIVSGQEALDMGLVHHCVAPEDLMSSTMELARELAEGPQLAMRLLKHSIYNADEMPFVHHMSDIASKTAITDHQPDAQEGISAWRAKRAPKFNEWIAGVNIPIPPSS